MARLEISILPINGIVGFSTSSLVSSLFILSKEKGGVCKITSTGEIVECDRDTLLRILKQLDGSQLDTLAKKFTVNVDFTDGSFDRISRDGKIEDDTFALDEDTMNREIASARPWRELIHDMVLSRLWRRTNRSI